MTGDVALKRTQSNVDVVIVGSGPAGSAYARIITDYAPRASVAVVEAGPAITTPPGQHSSTIADRAELARAKAMSQGPVYRSGGWTGAAERDREPAAERGDGLFLLSDGNAEMREFPAGSASSNVGGMGSHWFCCCPPPGGSEVIRCIQMARLTRAFAEANRLLDVASDRFESPAARYVSTMLGSLFDAGRPSNRMVQPMPLAASRPPGNATLHGPGVILGDVFDRPGARATSLTKTRALRVLVENGSAQGVELQSLDSGEIWTLRAKWVVVAADALRTPQLLFASGVRPPALGRYLNEHAMVVTMFELSSSEFMPSPSREAGISGAGGLFVSAANGVTWIPPLGEAFPCSIQTFEIDGASLPPEQLADAGGKPVFAAGGFVAKDVRSEDRIEFSEGEKDWAGLPKIAVRYGLTALDQTRIEATRAALTKMASMGRPLFKEPRLLPPGSSLHYQGTYRLGGQDDGSSVCDPTCRVWGVTNLFLGGNGLIPTETACNPTLTSVALATIGAEQISSMLRASRRAGGRA
jgi:choline dehydrogenase-like flavoprotein